MGKSRKKGKVQQPKKYAPVSPEEVEEDWKKAKVLLFLSAWAFGSWFVIDWLWSLGWYFIVIYFAVTVLLFIWGIRRIGIRLGPWFPESSQRRSQHNQQDAHKHEP